jgi:EpsI family protein
MTRRLRINILLGLALLTTAVGTSLLTPVTRLAAARERFDLAAAIPARFSGWTVDTGLAPVTPNPDSQAALDRIYDQTLARTYIDANGQRVMLSIAYGGDQSKALQLHLPEVCYVAQGFQIVQKGEGTLATGFGSLPVRRLVARADMRNEPITYWITVGDQLTRSGFAQKLQLLAYGLSGKIPDGMLVRVSSITPDALAAYQLQDGFSAALLAALTPQARTRLLGSTHAAPEASVTQGGAQHAQPGVAHALPRSALAADAGRQLPAAGVVHR